MRKNSFQVVSLVRREVVNLLRPEVVNLNRRGVVNLSDFSNHINQRILIKLLSIEEFLQQMSLAV
jgi:hypothetical protein